MKITRENIVPIWLAILAWALFGLFVAARVQSAEPYIYPVPSPVPASFKPYAPICHIRNGNISGSGTLIATRPDGSALVLSCRHVNQQVGNVVEISWPLAGGQTSPGVVWDVIPGDGFDTDIALVICEAPIGVSPVSVAKFDPRDGGYVAAGWRDGMLRVAPWPLAELRGQSLIWCNTPYIGGMSGGALFNRKGELVGVVVASDRVTWGVSVDGPLLHHTIAKYRSNQ
jgi:hypothetical protein